MENLDWGSISLPSLKDIGIVTGCVLFVFALGRGWIFVSSQVVKMIDAWKEIARLWEEVAKERQQTIQTLTESGFEPVIQGNEAILKALEGLQQERRRSSPERRR